LIGFGFAFGGTLEIPFANDGDPSSDDHPAKATWTPPRALPHSVVFPQDTRSGVPTPGLSPLFSWQSSLCLSLLCGSMLKHVEAAEQKLLSRIPWIPWIWQVLLHLAHPFLILPEFVTQFAAPKTGFCNGNPPAMAWSRSR